jgi:chromosome segregation ATPase
MPSGKYSDLRTRFDDAVVLLEAVTGKVEKDQDRIRNLEKSRRILVGQILNLDCNVRDLEKKLAITEDQLRISRRNEADLHSQLIKIKPLASTKT